ncbi:hypothetical protein ANOBCDAF_04518 [Pleomorphomonas sp. T1.2MG-36]|uniref:DUF535 family protein n=1 Tax=Pleomorphomonas sp. T1.2MG-36 TaxID=3041167 RepID=UPI0024778FC8|nr:DUF535 family protein [Pleomorphomonas sp. T1.2MG-36]CAI9403927.1 hypothetical protein ANOBCDAF_04518 [Pleomorphomonas sp. T1.2MG-36]
MHLDKILSAQEPLACEPYRPAGLANPRWAIACRILTAFARLSWKRGLLLWLRFLVYPRATLGWWRWLAGVVASRGYPLPHDDLLQKPLMKFLALGLSGTQRLGLLTGHFTIADKILSRDSMVRLWQGETLVMGEVPGRGDAYRCLIMLADRCGGRHEGAFAVRLVRIRDGATLCTVRFTLVYEDLGQRYTFVVGSMQGPRNAKRLIIEATRDLSGLRPKEAVLMVLQGLAAEGRARHFHAVSRARHPIRYRRARRQSMMMSDVDGFWSERSGEPDDGFGFTVPYSRIGGHDRRAASKAQFYGVGELFC